MKLENNNCLEHNVEVVMFILILFTVVVIIIATMVTIAGDGASVPTSSYLVLCG